MGTMKVLVTGALGNLGIRTVAELRRRGHAVRALDLETRATKKRARTLDPGVEVMFGDLTRDVDIRRAVAGMDAVVHDAAILPPMTEKLPEVGTRINRDATLSLLRAFEEETGGARGPFVFASSVSVYGRDRAERDALLGAGDATAESDHYTEAKLACEAAIRSSTAPAVILRIGVALDETSMNTDPIVFRQMFEIDPDEPVHFVHTEDVAHAQAAAVEVEAARGKVLPIGGGEGCRIRQRDLMAMMSTLLRLGELPERAFGNAPNYTAWMDTAESQALLDFQRRSFAETREGVMRRFAALGPLFFLSRPLTKAAILRLSGPYRGDVPRPTWRDFESFWR